ncbi:MAG: TetR/AcrR family transcriptional regulator [Candidatus Symbiothrix sp.]|jgi:AcrR family transcriptional regulator|nr:TetR/AcrR family transcriptional regulator [Candidatus Symbiothrix sp.]
MGLLRERIVQEASALFFTKGVKGMTMSDIANELGISKRTLYEIFSDKEELLEICINLNMEKVDRETRELFSDSEDVIDTLMRIYASHLRNVQNVNKSFIHDLRKYHTAIFKKIENRQKESINSFLPLFEKGVAQGLIRGDVKFEVLIWLLKSQFKALMDDDFIPTDKYSTNEFIRAIILNFIRGISTPLGNEKVDKIVLELEKRQ